ncbi:hypothetical protein J6590_087297 [Homalodisca vitripennis]|nr:hypothetical protein J6590_087297 [Homalodisca vitripennis]
MTIVKSKIKVLDLRNSESVKHESACCLPTPVSQTSAQLFTPKVLGTLPCPRYTVPTTSSSSKRNLASSH